MIFAALASPLLAVFPLFPASLSWAASFFVGVCSHRVARRGIGRAFLWGFG